MRPDFADPFWGYYQQYYNPAIDDMVQYSIFEGGIYGMPSAGRSGNLSLTLANNLEMKVRNRRQAENSSRKISIFDNLSFSGGYDFARDSLNVNDIVVNGRTRLGRIDVNFGSAWTVYDTDTLGRRINQFLWDTKGKPFRMNNSRMGFALSYNLNSQSRAVPPTNISQIPGQDFMDTFADPETLEEPAEQFVPPVVSPYSGFDLTVPWNLSINYNFDYSTRYQPREAIFSRQVTQTLRLSGNVNLTPKWRIMFNTGYDFTNNAISYTSLNIQRDLHCWEMLIDWVPFGFRRYYGLTIRVKSSMLQDLKLSRRTSHLDNQLMNF
jgi:hypothetical protein